jgi:hypothetical protein
VFHGRVERVGLRVDALILEPDEDRVSLILRANVQLGRGADHSHTLVRALEAWEPMPPLAHEQGTNRQVPRGARR